MFPVPTVSGTTPSILSGCQRKRAAALAGLNRPSIETSWPLIATALLVRLLCAEVESDLLRDPASVKDDVPVAFSRTAAERTDKTLLLAFVRRHAKDVVIFNFFVPDLVGCLLSFRG